MNSRRLIFDMELLPALAQPSVFRTLKLPQKGRQVFGADLNRSESEAATEPLLCCYQE